MTLTPLIYKLLIAVALLATGCSAGTGSGDYREAGQIVSMPPKPDKVDPKALAATCSYTGLYGVALESCVRLLAAKLPPFDPTRPDHFGELYSPQKYYECKLKNPSNLGCEEFALRRPENPEYWPYPGVPKPKWPEAPKQSVYRSGMNGKEYFEALCKAEAGEFVYRTVNNVEGIYIVRPRAWQEGNKDMKDRYAIEDPFGYLGADRYGYAAEEFVQPFFGKYKFLEVPNGATTRGGAITRYYRDENANPGKTTNSAKDGRLVSVPSIVASEQTEKSQSRYGYVWRGITRPHDRELGVAGGEMLILDLKTNEVLGLRRGFARSGPTHFFWLTAQSCPQLHMVIQERQMKKPDYWFIYEVLKPIADINDHIEGK